MLRRGFRYNVWHFANFPIFGEIWELVPLIYCKNTLKNKRKSKTILIYVILWKLRICKFVRFGKCVHRGSELLAFRMSKFGNLESVKHLGKVWKRWKPDKCEDLSSYFLKILDMGSISSRKHEMVSLGNLYLFQPHSHIAI